MLLQTYCSIVLAASEARKLDLVKARVQNTYLFDCTISGQNSVCRRKKALTKDEAQPFFLLHSFVLDRSSSCNLTGSKFKMLHALVSLFI